MKDLLSRPHLIFSVENPKYKDKAQAKIGHEDALKLMRLQGYGNKNNVHSIEGKYGNPEKSIFISEPTEEQTEYARTIAHMIGQDSHIESDGKIHKIYYSHGPDAGKIVEREGTTIHENEPEDCYSILPDGTIFTHNFNKSLDKAIHSPSKHIPLSRLKQIKQDNYIEETGKEFSQEELDQSIHERGESHAKNMLREAAAREKRIAREIASGKGEALPSKLKKAMSHEELKNQGYRFTILKPTKSRDAFAVRVYHGKKAVGHLAFSGRARSYTDTNPDAHKTGYHSVFNSHIEESHRGKGIYQHMLKLAAQHAKSIGSKGILSEGHQRSKAATRAWDKVATHAGIKNPITGLEGKATSDNSDYFLAASEIAKGARGDWRKEGYKIAHKEVPEVFRGKQTGFVTHHVTAFSPNGEEAGHYQFSQWPAEDEKSALLDVNSANTHPDHQRKGLASAVYSYIENKTGRKIGRQGMQTQDARKFWEQPNRTFGKSNKAVGGKGDRKQLKDFNPKEVSMGRKVEMEHTSDPKIAEEILSDHLTENPRYYSKLRESGLADELKKRYASDYSAPKVNINPEHGKKIADAYESMKHDPHHPEVKAAYDALISETKKQYQDLLNQGFKFTKVTDPLKYPYKNSKEMHHDIEHNKHLYYLPTEDGSFGSETSAPKDHPLLTPTQFKSHDGKPMLANCLLRQVHDINGHFHGGKTTFGPAGEHQAYLNHKKMYSEKAQPALANELIMQNSYVNFGPHSEHNRKNPTNTIYAPQKAGLVPDWVWRGKWHE